MIAALRIVISDIKLVLEHLICCLAYTMLQHAFDILWCKNLWKLKLHYGLLFDYMPLRNKFLVSISHPINPFVIKFILFISVKWEKAINNQSVIFVVNFFTEENF